MFWTPVKTHVCRGLFALMAVGILSHTAHSFAYTPEPDLLAIKGYSPDTVSVIQTQRSRQEWKQPAPRTLGPVGRFLKNIYFNEWTGNLDPFGSAVIRNH